MIYPYDLDYVPDNGIGHRGYDFGFLLEEYPLIPNAELVYNTYTIPGRGELVEGNSYRKNISISAPMTLVIEDVDQLQYLDYVRKVERWLQGPGWVKFSDTADTKYRVLKIQHNNEGRVTPVFGRINPVFLCEPYEYKEDGFIAYPQIQYNPYDMCKPIYRISGEGSGVLTVNGKSVAVNVGQNLTIDTAKQVTYRTDSEELINTAISGDYEDLWLDSGNVSVGITGGLTVAIEPRWGWNK